MILGNVMYRVMNASDTDPLEVDLGKWEIQLRKGSLSLVVSSGYCSEIFSDLFAFDLRGDPHNAAATCRQVHVLSSEHCVRYFSYR
jgi:hypothetical protein